MKHIEGQTRKQTFLFPISLDAPTSQDNDLELLIYLLTALILQKCVLKQGLWILAD